MKETQTCHNVAPSEHFDAGLRRSPRQFYSGRESKSKCAFVKGFASKSRRDGLLAKGELQTETVGCARRGSQDSRDVARYLAPPGIGAYADVLRCFAAWQRAFVINWLRALMQSPPFAEERARKAAREAERHRDKACI